MGTYGAFTVISDGNTWGGLMIARPAPDTDTDRSTVEDDGFTILGQDDRAGASYLWVYGTSASVGAYIADIDNKLAIPSWFFPIPKGEEVTLVRVKQWDPYRRLAY